MADLSFLLSSQQVQVRWNGADDQEQMTFGVIREAANDRVSIRFTAEHGPSAPFEPGQELRVQTANASGLYVLNLTVEGYNLVGDVLFASVSGEIRRIQRRQFVRVRVDLPTMTAYLLSDTKTPANRFAIRIIDLSGGGIQFECLEPLQRDDLLQVILRLNDARAFSPLVRVIDSAEELLTDSTGSQYSKFHVRGFFSAIGERERQGIIQFIFRKQAEERRKRIGS